MLVICLSTYPQPLHVKGSIPSNSIPSRPVALSNHTCRICVQWAKVIATCIPDVKIVHVWWKWWKSNHIYFHHTRICFTTLDNRCIYNCHLQLPTFEALDPMGFRLEAPMNAASMDKVLHWVRFGATWGFIMLFSEAWLRFGEVF